MGDLLRWDVVPSAPPHPINLGSPLRLGTSLRFPLQSRLSRREVLIGGLLLLLPVVGWLLNMGHRIEMTHRMQHGLPAWPSWPRWGNWVMWRRLLRHGVLTFLGMVQYHAPAALCHGLAVAMEWSWLHWAGAALWIAATIAVPGYMSHYCVAFDAREIFDPWRALRRVAQGGAAYWHAWMIALCAMALSLAGVLALGVGFLVTSVWFWQAAGFSFATVFTRRFGLSATPSVGDSNVPGAGAAPSR